MFTEQDTACIRAHGLTPEAVERQLENFRRGFPFLKVVRAAAPGDGILVPGGFGDRGIEGKIEAVRYAREHKKPYLGLCLGMQMAVIEFARNVGGLEGASSSEFGQHKYDVIDIMPDQKGVDMGGTMRLGLYPCKLDEDSISRELYGEGLIYERHRHRYEFNNTYREQLAAKGLKFAR